MTNKERALETFRRAVLLSEAASALPFRITAIKAGEFSPDGTSVEEWHTAFKGVAAAIEPVRDQMIKQAIALWNRDGFELLVFEEVAQYYERVGSSKTPEREAWIVWSSEYTDVGAVHWDEQEKEYVFASSPGGGGMGCPLMAGHLREISAFCEERTRSRSEEESDPPPLDI